MVILPIEVQRKLARSLVLALLLLQMSMILAVYLVSGLKGYLELPKIFISNAFRVDPARAIAAFVLPLCAFISFMLVGLRCLLLHDLLRNPVDKRLFWTTVVFMSTSALGMVAVSAVSIDTMKLLHWIVAATMFGSSTVVMCLISVIEHRIGLQQPAWLHRSRIGMFALSIVAIVVLMATSTIQPLVASIAELVLAALLLAWSVTLVHGSSFPLVAFKEPRSPRPSGEYLIRDEL